MDEDHIFTLGLVGTNTFKCDSTGEDIAIGNPYKIEYCPICGDSVDVRPED